MTMSVNQQSQQYPLSMRTQKNARILSWGLLASIPLVNEICLFFHAYRNFIKKIFLIISSFCRTNSKIFLQRWAKRHNSQRVLVRFRGAKANVRLSVPHAAPRGDTQL